MLKLQETQIEECPFRQEGIHRRTTNPTKSHTPQDENLDDDLIGVTTMIDVTLAMIEWTECDQKKLKTQIVATASRLNWIYWQIQKRRRKRLKDQCCQCKKIFQMIRMSMNEKMHL